MQLDTTFTKWLENARPLARIGLPNNSDAQFILSYEYSDGSLDEDPECPSGFYDFDNNPLDIHPSGHQQLMIEATLEKTLQELEAILLTAIDQMGKDYFEDAKLCICFSDFNGIITPEIIFSLTNGVQISGKTISELSLDAQKQLLPQAA